MSKQTHWTQVCPYCGEKTRSGHLVPPSLGDPAIKVCADVNRREQENGMPKNRDWTQSLSPSASTPPEPKLTASKKSGE